MAELIQGKNQYVYFMVQRKLEYVGTADGSTKEYTVLKKPLADVNLDGSVTIADVSCYEGTNRQATLTAVTVSAVDEKTGKVTLTAAPTKDKKIYISYSYIYGYVAYAQEYSLSETLETSEITPLSKASSEVMETVWKYEGSIKLWDDTSVENELMRGLDQTADTTAGTLAKTNPIPVPYHNVVLKKVRATATEYTALKGVKFISKEESAKGGDLAEKDFKISVDDIVVGYVPTTDSGM